MEKKGVALLLYLIHRVNTVPANPCTPPSSTNAVVDRRDWDLFFVWNWFCRVRIDGDTVYIVLPAQRIVVVHVRGPVAAVRCHCSAIEREQRRVMTLGTHHPHRHLRKFEVLPNLDDAFESRRVVTSIHPWCCVHISITRHEPTAA